MSGGFWHPLKRAGEAAAVMLAHALLAIAVLAGIWLVEEAFHLLWGARQPLLFDRVPIVYIFHTLDLAVLALFAFYGILEANKAFRGR